MMKATDRCEADPLLRSAANAHAAELSDSLAQNLAIGRSVIARVEMCREASILVP